MPRFKLRYDNDSFIVSNEKMTSFYFQDGKDKSFEWFENDDNTLASNSVPLLMEERIAPKAVIENELTNKNNPTSNPIHNMSKNDNKMNTLSDTVLTVAIATKVAYNNNTNSNKNNNTSKNDDKRNKILPTTIKKKYHYIRR